MDSEIRHIPENEIQKTLFLTWLEEIKKQPKRRDYKVPAKIIELPCGCKRERINESDPNNVWKIKFKQLSAEDRKNSGGRHE